jgi:biopolymer transport protein ExbD
MQPATTPHVNVTPLIDVVMCLIIFYLMVGHLAAGRSGHVDLPVSGTGIPEERAAPIVINVVDPEEAGKPPVLLIGDEVVRQLELATRLKQKALLTPGLEVQVRADKRLSYGAISPVLTACREAGLLSVKLVAQRGGSARQPGASPPGGAK